MNSTNSTSKFSMNHLYRQLKYANPKDRQRQKEAVERQFAKSGEEVKRLSQRTRVVSNSNLTNEDFNNKTGLLAKYV